MTVLWITLGVVLAVWITLLWTLRETRYRVTAEAFEISLGRFVVRRVPLRDIRHFSREGSFLAERWPNTLRPGRRTLVIERRPGWFRRLLVTLRHRYALQYRLRHAMKAARGTDLPALDDEPPAGERDRAFQEDRAATYLDRPHP